MKKIIYLAFIGLIGLLSSCEKDETKVVMLDSPNAPVLKTVPNVTLTRAQGKNTLVFLGEPANPGFTVSATYFLEACAKGNNFKDSLVIMSSTKADTFKITVSDLNGILLKKFDADKTSSVDFRIRSVFVIDAGTGVKGQTYSSLAKSADVTLYGLPRLDLLVDGNVIGKVESALGDGSYTGYVKVDKDKPFTLKDPDANKVYGATGEALAENGAAVAFDASGWYKLTVDTKGLSLKKDANMIGLVGSATPNGWNSPDQKMDYDAKSGTWSITVDLIAGDIKFRLNDGWAWNLGGTTSALTHNGANIAVAEAGNYTIKLTITNMTSGSEAGTFTIVKN